MRIIGNDGPERAVDGPITDEQAMLAANASSNKFHGEGKTVEACIMALVSIQIEMNARIGEILRRLDGGK